MIFYKNIFFKLISIDIIKKISIREKNDLKSHYCNADMFKKATTVTLTCLLVVGAKIQM